ncbi:MAG: hypothetical protein WBP81_03250 [Solirubrobacteraceae bacterium]
MTLGNLGILAARAGDLERGRSLIGGALALIEETDDAPGQVGMRLNLGNIAAHAGELELAEHFARPHVVTTQPPPAPPKPNPGGKSTIYLTGNFGLARAPAVS